MTGTFVARLETDAAAWDASVASSSTPAHLQTTAWAKIKRDNGWTSRRLATEVGGRTVGAQMLIRRPGGLPWGLGYIARGPIVEGSFDQEAIRAFTARVRRAGKRHRLGYVRLEPELEGGSDLERELLNAGWRRAPHVQPESTRMLDLTLDEAKLWSELHRKARQSVTKSERMGVRVVDASGDRLGEFYEIHADASRRAGVIPRAERTYRLMWDALQPRSMARLLFAELTATGEPVATLLLVSCGPRVVDLYGGTTRDGGRTRASYLLKWEAIKRCRAAGLREYDLWGLPREGIAQFKSGFGGREVHYVGAFDLTTDRIGAGVLAVGQRLRDAYLRRRYGRPSSSAEGEDASVQA